jgi:hypothetical protein
MCHVASRGHPSTLDAREYLMQREAETGAQSVRFVCLTSYGATGAGPGCQLHGALCRRRRHYHQQ